jgi:feruloyl-CoA synthase
MTSNQTVLQDGLVTGHDKNYLGFLAWPNIEACKKFLGKELEIKEIINHPLLREEIKKNIILHNKNFPGSSTKIKKLILMDTPPSFDNNEITDKGYVNQSSALVARDNLVNKLYDKFNNSEEVIVI